MNLCSGFFWDNFESWFLAALKAVKLEGVCVCAGGSTGGLACNLGFLGALQ